MSPKVLITGGAGFIGSNTAEDFASEGWKVTVLDNLGRSGLFGSKQKSVEYNWQFLQTLGRVECVRADIRNFKSLLILFQKRRFDLVIHAASQPGVRKSLEDPSEDFSINAQGTFNVLEALRQTNPEGALIYLSTNKVYGENVTEIPFLEKKMRYTFSGRKGVGETLSTDLTGHTPYGISKFVGDLYTQEYGITYGLKTAVFRMSCIYGPRQFGFEDQGWLAWFMIAQLKKKPISIYGNGKQVRDVLYVKDLIRAMKLFHRSKIKHGVWNIGGGPEKTLSLLELVAMIEKLSGKKLNPHYRNWRPHDQRVYITDLSKARKELRWQPRWSVEKGVESLFDWVQAQRHLF